MGSLASSMGPVVILNGNWCVHGLCVMFLGLTLLVTVLQASAHIAVKSRLDSTSEERFPQDGPNLRLLQPTRPVSHTEASGDPETNAATLSLSPDVLPHDPRLNFDTGTADNGFFKRGLSPSQNPKSFTSSDLIAKQPVPFSTPPSSPSEPGLGPDFEGAARLSTDLKLARTNLTQLSSSQSPLTTTKRQPQINATTRSTKELILPALVRPSTPQFVLDDSHTGEAPLAHSNHSGSTPKPTLGTTTSLSVRTQKPVLPPMAVPAFHPDVSSSLEHPIMYPKPSNNVLDVTRLRPSRSLMQQDEPAHDFHNLDPPPEILAPSYLPFISPHPTSPWSDSEPTEALTGDLFPTNTGDVDWGSGEYMETMLFLGSEGDDYSLVSNLPSDMYDLEDSATESYDTSFPTRVGVSLSSYHPHVLPSQSLRTTVSSVGSPTSIHPIPFSSSVQRSLEPTPPVYSDVTEASDVDWSDALTVQPTDFLLPDMNSLEYYTTQLTKENASLNTGTEHSRNVTNLSLVSQLLISTEHLTATRTFTIDPSQMLTALFGNGGLKPTHNNTWMESSGDLSGYEPLNETSPVNTTALNLPPALVSETFGDTSTAASPSLHVSSLFWDAKVSSLTPTPAMAFDSTRLAVSAPSGASALLPDDFITSSSLTDVYWFTTESVLLSTSTITPVLSATVDATSVPSEEAPNATAITAEETPNFSTESVTNVTSVPPFMVGDQGVPEEATDHTAIVTTTSITPKANITSVTSTTTMATTSIQKYNTTTVSTEAATRLSATSIAASKSPATTSMARQYLCNIDKPAYAVRVGFPSGATVGYAKSQIRDVLKNEFNKSVELQVLQPPPKFVFRVVSGPAVYTAISVINALRRSGRRFLAVSPSWTVPDNKYLVHSVLQFVPSHVDVRACNFSERMEKGLTMAFAEVRRRAQESTNFTVHTVNITMAAPRSQQQPKVKEPVDITFAIRGTRGYLLGSEVTNLLLKLTIVEFSYYMGFPVLQIAEPFHYPELNTTQLLRSSWVRTVLLGVLDPRVGEQSFHAKMERQLALLLGEALGMVRRTKRATSVGNNSIQVVSTTRPVGADHPLEIVYFVEGSSGQRLPATQTTNLLNSLDVQRAAIVLGYRVQGILAQPVEKVLTEPSDSENTVLWIVIGVVIPLLVVIVIVSILYWKLCRTDKLEFQPDAMTSIQQRQKLQAPTVKGFDFAKLHLGQHSKDDIMVIQEPAPQGPLPVTAKEGIGPAEKLPTPKSKTSICSAKASLSGRRRERISPSDGDSVVSDCSSGRESGEENRRGQATPSDSKQPRKIPINVLNGKNRIGPPPMNGTEQLSSASIFEHVDRMSRSTDASRRLPNKIQLIAMQPMPMPPVHAHPTINGRVPENNQINKEIQVALRHKSEIEHHRNKIRLRAKRKGHYDFPAMENLSNGFGDAKDQGRIYQKARQQIDKILDPDVQVASIFMESKKGARGKRSPKQRKKDHLTDADKDHLISNDGDAIYRRCPGVNNVAFVSDPDHGPGSPPRSPSPTDDVFLGPSSPPRGHAPPPPPYMPPQPSIEEARQQMHSLLDDAFALVSPTSQGSTAGITLPGVNSLNSSGSSPPASAPKLWGSSHPPFSSFPGPLPLSHPPHPQRYIDLGMPPPSVQSLLHRQGPGSGFLPPGEPPAAGDQLQPDGLYPSKGLYTEEQPLSARPRPVGGTTGSQLHHLTQVGLSSRINGYPAGGRGTAGQNGGVGWNHYHDNSFSAAGPARDALLDFPDHSPHSIFQMPRSGIREPSAPPAHQNTPGLGYPSAPEPVDTCPPTHSSASLIKAIREELLRLSQKQASVPSYHS